MRTLLTLFKIMFFLSFLLAKGQEQLSASIHQDFKLLVTGDKDHNYDPLTINVMARLKMQGNQQKFGYLTIWPQVEFADLKVAYYRYSANIGYTLNQFKWFELVPYAGVGLVNHGKGYSNFSLGGEISVPIGKRFKASYVGEYTNRKELKKNIYSGYIGIEFNFN